MKYTLRSLSVSGALLMGRFLSRGFGSYVIGSSSARLAFGAALSPLAGYYGGFKSVGFLGLVSFFVNSLLAKGAFSWVALSLSVPGMVGGFFLASTQRGAKILFFLGAIFLFGVHPLGAEVFPYALVWLIPLWLLATQQQSFFAQALISTFAVHATGACIWLYTVPMASSLWVTMIPQVLIERFMYALAMTTVVALIEKSKNLVVLLSLRPSWLR